MDNVEILKDENKILISDEYGTKNVCIIPSEKKIKVSSHEKESFSTHHEVFQYKISTNPVRVSLRTWDYFIDNIDGTIHCVGDGVLLESEIQKNKQFMLWNSLEDMREKLRWQKAPLHSFYPIVFFILSKHLDIISIEDYRHYLQAISQNFKKALFKLEQNIVRDRPDLEVVCKNSTKSIWYNCDIDDEKVDENDIIGYIDKLFKEDSKEYVGISFADFQVSDDIINHIEKLLSIEYSDTETGGFKKFLKTFLKLG